MNDTLSAPVGIVGGGPVGMMLALFLERHGVGAVLFNTEDHSRWHPKGSTHNSRSMEHYRRLGFSTEVRKLGLPPDHPTDVAYFTRYTGWEMARIALPTESQRMAAVAASPATDQVPEPIHRANQMYVEKFLFDRVAVAFLTRRYGWRVSDMRQDADGVNVAAERVGDGAREDWRFQYLVGCDGGQSVIRRTLGIRYSGFDTLEQEFMGGRMIATYLRLPTLLAEVIGRGRRAWQYVSITPGRRMVLVSLDGKEEFLLFTRAPDPNVAPDDDAIRAHVRRAVGADLPVEVLGHNPWTAGAALVAERFGQGRVLLAGDAVHLFTPTGGFGMNTGIDDAANLAWKLAATVQGWGGPHLLGTYEPERRPIAVRNTTAARTLAITAGEMPVAATIDDDSDAGAAARRRFGEFIASRLGEEFASIGVQLGARYDGSRIVAEDGAPPAADPIVYRPSSVPGGRAPHVWLGRGRGIGDSLFDQLGRGFTLLCLGARPPDTRALAGAAARRGIDLAVLHRADAAARALYERDVALIRPDQHVAWRGNALPDDCDRLLARVTGYV
ncbi:MAG TPA: FAD-dependent monooxygenase [Stellaceae bacterium]|nr:FAD-dependent monooxygenase [Stellaceae bacterium]